MNIGIILNSNYYRDFELEILRNNLKPHFYFYFYLRNPQSLLVCSN